MRNPKKTIGWAVGILLAFWIITAPVAAAGAFNNGVGKLEDAANSATTFASNLFAG